MKHLAQAQDGEVSVRSRPGRGLDLHGGAARRLSGGGEPDAFVDEFRLFRHTIVTKSPLRFLHLHPPDTGGGAAGVRPGEGAGHRRGKACVELDLGSERLAARPPPRRRRAARAEDPEPVIEDVLEILKERGIVDEGQYNELVAKNADLRGEATARSSVASSSRATCGSATRTSGTTRTTFGVDRTNRNRLRYRLRLSAKAEINEYVDAVLPARLRRERHRSTNRTLGVDDDFEPDAIFIDQAYLVLQAPRRSWLGGRDVTAIGGKVPNPFLWKTRAGTTCSGTRTSTPRAWGSQLGYSPART